VKREELSTKQSDTQQLISARLSGAGWKTTDFQKLFESGEDSEFPASLEYENGHLQLYLNYIVDDDLIGFGLYEPTGRELHLRVDCDDDITDLLNVITGFQDKISPDNFREHIRQIVRACPETYAIIDEEEADIRKVLDEEAESTG
jgi:hypothetical protein